MIHEIVDGKLVESRHYPKNEFATLSPKQRGTVIRLNRERKSKARRNKSSNNVSAMSTHDRDHLTDDMITVGNAIVAAMTKAQGEKPDDVTEITADTNNENSNKRSSASSGSVGDFFAAARKRGQSNM